jgi:hypothetical protein
MRRAQEILSENPCEAGVFLSSESGTRTRDSRPMKPVQPVSEMGATSKRYNDLGKRVFVYFRETQQKAQHFEGVNAPDQEWDRLKQIWSLLHPQDHKMLVHEAEEILKLEDPGFDANDRR